MKENKKILWVWNISRINSTFLFPSLPAQGPGSSPAQGTWGGLVVDIPTKLFTRHQGLIQGAWIILLDLSPISGMQTAGYICFVNFAAKDVLKKSKVSVFQNGEALSGVLTSIFVGQKSEINTALHIFWCVGVAYIWSNMLCWSNTRHCTYPNLCMIFNTRKFH